METDPLQHFDEQQRSWEGLEGAKKALLAEAMELHRVQPDLEVVGLVAEANSSEAAPFLAALKQATGQVPTERGIMILVPRDFLLTILRANAPATLDWLPSSRTPTGSRVLPLCAATKNGYRFGSVAYEA